MLASGMHAAFLLGALMLLVLVVADWIAFTRKNPGAAGYGFAVSRQEEILDILPAHFNAKGVMPLTCGLARLLPDQHTILLLPDWKQAGLKFRTAWPLNGELWYGSLGEKIQVRLVKRMPWSSALLTCLWFLTVAGGIILYIVSYAQAGGFSSATGAFLALALSGLGVLVMLFGMIIVIAAYRLEDKRLMAVYQDFRRTLLVSGSAFVDQSR
jgi:hypothetical protein